LGLRRVIIQSGGIQGDVTLTQYSRFEPTFLNFNLTTARGDLETRLVYSSSVAGYKIHELPIKPAKTVGQNENSCLTTKFVYNPGRSDPNRVPPNGGCGSFGGENLDGVLQVWARRTSTLWGICPGSSWGATTRRF
jgi:hypothetical protein